MFYSDDRYLYIYSSKQIKETSAVKKITPTLTCSIPLASPLMLTKYTILCTYNPIAIRPAGYSLAICCEQLNVYSLLENLTDVAIA